MSVTEMNKLKKSLIIESHEASEDAEDLRDTLKALQVGEFVSWNIVCEKLDKKKSLRIKRG